MKTYEITSLSKDRNIYIQTIKADNIESAKIILAETIVKMGWDRFEYEIQTIRIIQDTQDTYKLEPKKSKMRILIDVDGTVVDTFDIWDKFLKRTFNISYKDIQDRNLEYFNERNIDPMIFWRNDTLYDDLEPNESKIYIDLLSLKHEIIFVSACFDEHLKSKKRFIRKYFPYAKFIETEYKHLINTDIIIDDYNTYLEKSSAKYKIKIKNKYNSKNTKFFYKNWKETYNFIKDLK